MEPYSRYLDDENFIDWVYHPTEKNCDFWESYIIENPSEKESIETLKNLLLNLKTEDHLLSKQEKKEILEHILNKASNIKKQPTRVYRLTKKYYKYAAIIIIAITTGVFVEMQSNKEEPLPFNNIQVSSLDSISNTQLTFATGKQLSIKEEKSSIEYNNQGKIIVNQNDTISNNVASVKETEALNTLIVPYGRRSKITLEDGTIVHLNAGTQFVFPEKFLGDKRTVYLSGEGFFEVSTNKERPFIVKTIVDKISVEVVGTKFNVSAYPSDNEVLTVLTEGKVNVIEKMMLKRSKTPLVPGELAAWNKDDETIKVKTVDTNNYTSWTQGLLYFESDPINKVVKKLERFYNIDIDFDEAVKDQLNTNISGKLDLNEDINMTLENLTRTASFKCEKINNRKYMIK